MPVTAKLSRGFYEKLGDDVSNELVEWLNAVDTSYRQEFRELFEAHFGRLEARIVALEGLMAALESRLESRLDLRMNALESRLEARMDARLEALKAELLRWLFLFWVGTMGTVLAILKL
jgi:hypothetical protein